MPYLGVSQRPVVAKRLQGSRTDTKLLADILTSNTSFEIITNSFIAYTVFIVGNPVCLQSKANTSIGQWLYY